MYLKHSKDGTSADINIHKCDHWFIISVHNLWFLASSMWGFPVFVLVYVIVKWIDLGFGALVGHNKEVEDVKLDCGKTDGAFMD